MKPEPIARLGVAFRIMYAWWAALAALAAIAGLVVLLSSTDHPTGCIVFCPSNRTLALLVIGGVGVPMTLIGLIVGTVVLRYRLRHCRTAFAAGTVAALTGMVSGLIATWSAVLVQLVRRTRPTLADRLSSVRRP
ncbi:hypothetical protein [Micromonospora sp. NPDC006431]|uniref:hypothetical protein n=1 Tax=Micromonospora sp. NPDC006431 TaxID=3364235 RepID=UPI00367C1000